MARRDGGKFIKNRSKALTIKEKACYYRRFSGYA
jgi:hypothetical protein